MNHLTQEEVEKRVRIKTKGEYEVVGDYENTYAPILLKHTKCGTVFKKDVAMSVIYKGTAVCPECKHYKYFDEYYPDLVSLFKNPQDAHISKTSQKYVTVVCPVCKQEKKMQVHVLSMLQHVTCPTCNDGFSYPEKFMANIFKQLHVIYDYQFHEEWCNPYKYDFKFELDDTKYIVELDGGIGHGKESTHYLPAEVTSFRDLDKDLLAKAHGYKIIRIDCDYPPDKRFVFIREKILSSQLSKIFDLSQIDFNVCNTYANSSFFREVIEIYKGHTKYVSEISECTGLKPRTIKKYLVEAMDMGIIPKEVLLEKNISKEYPIPMICVSTEKSFGKPIYCYEDALLFQTVTDTAKYYGYNLGSLTVSLKKYGGFHKGRHFIFADKLPNDFEYKPIVFDDSSYSTHAVCQLTLDGDVVAYYKKISDIPIQFAASNVWRACVSKGNTAYGYKWRYLTKAEELQLF